MFNYRCSLLLSTIMTMSLTFLCMSYCIDNIINASYFNNVYLNAFAIILYFYSELYYNIH